jgi:N-acetylneuraminic acid mutarotase
LDYNDYVKTGGRYNPATDTWASVSLINAPSARKWHTAIWTGTEMIIWGGLSVMGFQDTGARYNPNTDTWIATAPSSISERYSHTAVWIGTEMIIWGGYGHLMIPGMRFGQAIRLQQERIILRSGLELR